MGRESRRDRALSLIDIQRNTSISCVAREGRNVKGNLRYLFSCGYGAEYHGTELSMSETQQPIVRAAGATPAERYLKRLCERSFLSLWSYPGVFRDQGHPGGDGKELCDLLVVFERHIIIFSDKDCRFGESGDLPLDWARWFRKAVLKSAEQTWGAERWIRSFPNRLFLDKKCTTPFPLELPKPDEAIFHRVVVAHDGARRCKEVLGGSGSLMINSHLVGDAHLQRPFTLGHIDPEKGYVHVFDDTTLNIVLETLDTISDFTAYLTKKEGFLSGEVVVEAAGEEELLANYLSRLNRDGEHDFVIKGTVDVISLAEGHWDRFTRSPQRRSQLAANRISYAWDKLIEKFAFHAMTGTQHFATRADLADQEKGFRFLAREPRVRRRILAQSLRGVLERSSQTSSAWDARVVLPSGKGDPHYVFVLAKRIPELSEEEYRMKRRVLLGNYCEVLKLKFPDATDIIGIATEDGAEERRSEDFAYLDGSKWTPEAEKEAREIQKQLGILKELKGFAARVHEYPANERGRMVQTAPSRNSPCPCGSGQRYKRCHGKPQRKKRGCKRRG